MRQRPIRSQIYLPVVKFGVIDSDWKFVLVISLIGYSVPFFLELKFWGIRLELWTGVVAFLLSVAFFNFVRIGRKPFWLAHHLRALLESPRHRHALPRDGSAARPWIKQER